MSYNPPVGSVVAFQSNPANLHASVTGTVRITSSVITVLAANQSVSGTVGASLIGLSPVSVSNFPSNQSVSGTVQVDVRGSVATVIIGGSIAASFTPPANQSVSGAVSISNFPTTQNVSGSVVATQGTTPWAVTNVGSLITVSQGSVATVIIGGSIAASFTPPANQSVSGTVLVNQGTNPWIITGSVQASLSPAANQSVSGTVGASVIGHAPVVIVGGSIAASFTPPANQSVSGTVTVNQGTDPWIQTGSVQGTMSVLGTVPVTQATTPWVVTGSVQAVALGNQSVSGTVAATQGTSPWVIQSIVGTYAEDLAHTNAQPGIFTLGRRNDTVTSVTSADNDYSGFMVDEAARHITKPFAPEGQTFRGSVALTSTSMTGLIVQAGAGLRNYITDLWVSNTGATTALVSIMDRDASVMAQTIAPAGGGSNLVGLNTPLRSAGQNQSVYAQVSAASSTIYINVLGYRAA